VQFAKEEEIFHLMAEAGVMEELFSGQL